MLLGTHGVELKLSLSSYLSISYLYDLGHFTTLMLCHFVLLQASRWSYHPGPNSLTYYSQATSYIFS